MTLEKAIEIRQRQLCGGAVNPVLLAEAIEVIKASHEPLSDSEVNEMRRKLPRKTDTQRPPRVRKGQENLRIPVLTEEDPAAVAPTLGAVDMDAIYRRNAS